MPVESRSRFIGLVTIVLTMLLIGGSATGDDGRSRLSGSSETVILPGGEYVESDLDLDKNANYLSSVLEISTLDPGSGTTAPADVSVFFDDVGTEVFSYSGTGYGALGLQDQFSDGNRIRSLLYPDTVTEEPFSFLLPANANVISATIDVMAVEKVLNWSGPISLVEYVNGSQLPFMTMGQISADFADTDDDGDLDLVKGGWSPIYSGDTYFYENVGTATDPVFSYSAEMSRNISMDVKANPRLTDIDRDGDYDLFVGQYWGNISFFRNTGTKEVPTWNEEEFLPTYFFGYEVCPSFVDLDGDGDEDMVVGQQSPGDALHYFRNDMDDKDLVFTKVDTFEEIVLERVNFPAFSDFDLDGDMDLFLGHWQPPLSLHENKGNSTTPKWSDEVELLNEMDFGYYQTPTFADLSGDGYEDLIIGVHDGRLNYLVRNVSYPGMVDIQFGPKPYSFPLDLRPRVNININITEGLKELVGHLNPTFEDNYTSFIRPSLTVTTDSIGGLTLSNLSIRYESTLRSRDLSDAINTFLQSERDVNPGSETAVADLIFYSGGPGALSYRLLYDLVRPLEVNDLDDEYFVNEDSHVRSLVDLFEYIDYDGEYGNLSITIDPISGMADNMYLEDDRYLSVDNTASPQFENWSGRQDLRISVIDDQGFLAISNVFTIVTLPINDPPMILDGSIWTAIEDSPYVYRLTVEDVDTVELTVSMPTSPPGLTIDGDGVLSWTPTGKDVGVHDVVIAVGDGEYEVNRSYKLRVLNVNDAPIFVENPVVVVKEGETYSFEWTGVVYDEDTPSSRLVLTVDSAFVVANGPFLDILVPVDAIEGDELSVPISVSDGIDSDSTRMLIIVSRGEGVITFGEIPLFDVFKGRTYSLDISPYLVLQGIVNEKVQIVVDHDYITTDGLVISILVPTDGDPGLFNVLLCATGGESTAYSVMRVNVLDEGYEGMISNIPLIVIVEDTTTEIDIGLYMSDNIRGTHVSIESESEHFVRSDNQSVFLLYTDPTELDEIECTMIYMGDQEIGFNLKVRVVPANSPPILIKSIPDFVIRPDGDVEIDLHEFFWDAEGDQIVFQASSQLVSIGDNWTMTISYMDGDHGDVVCTITATEVSDSSHAIDSNEFRIVFQTNDNGADDGWMLLISIIVLIFLVSIIGLFVSRRTPRNR